MTSPRGEEYRIKLARIRAFLAERGFDAFVFGTRRGVAWLTAGGDNVVLRSAPDSAGLLVVTAERVYSIAWVIDAGWIADLVLPPGSDIETVAVTPYAMSSLVEQVRRLLGAGRVAADVTVPGWIDATHDLRYALQLPLLPAEVARYRAYCQESATILEGVAHEILPRMTEREIAHRIMCAYDRADFQVDVLWVGTDEHIARYRHPQITDRQLERYALLSPAVSKGGLFIVNTRLVHFGPPPAEVRAAFHAVTTIVATMMATARPGMPFATLHARQRDLYAEVGYADEWNTHFQGGVVGYFPGDTGIRLTDAPVRDTMALGWWVTVTGCKTEDTWLIGPDGGELMTTTGDWPMETIDAAGRAMRVPGMLVR